MKNFKKILVLALAVIMCLTALAVPTFAATFNPEVSITARFNDEGNRIIASVVTKEKAGAIQGTLTYSGLTFDETKIDFSEKNNIEKHVHDKDNKTIKFVLLANNLNDGDTHWADFYFEVPESGSVTFGLENVAVCDVNENLADAVSVPDVTLTLTENDLTTLGAQYRATNPALRFGTKLDRAQADNALVSKEGAKAVRCGYIAGFKFKVGEATLTATDFSTETGRFTTVTTGAIYKQAKYCLTDTEDYMIYTYAVTGITDDKQVDTDGNEEVDAYVKDLPIVVRPYVIYELDGQYGIDYGTQVSKCYADVQAASGLLDATLGYK